MTTAPIRLIVGLGNPGPEYEATRHNAGFWLADHFADDLRVDFTLEKPFFAWVARARHAGQAVVLAKPATFMNKSGQAVGALARFYKLQPEEILVLHDELDLLPGAVKLKLGGGHAGHNGLRDIQAALGSPNFWRLRIGIGHPRSLGLAQQVVNFVLHPPRKDDMPGIEDVINRCRIVLPQLLDGAFDRATERLHQANHA
ncbi:aminoacyl-tRNA hydrolase [Castellaniella denitrificans]|uniref:Peptidyl-tRNA hydrolase n=1 Tax=Castellaniella denitrificans TaxID=56119 RepID=A0ABT4M2M9_9BURK|nr:aminoacyl-tRNA hydrolase [Castellaniella denitrificans]MCZ4329562.1 aminoacyl-tRNA hydrolase [Castellaniella denitrificans]